MTAQWVRFAAVQGVQWFFAVVGWFLLLPLCLAHAWEQGEAGVGPIRTIDKWKWKWVDEIWGNPADGVSGQYAHTEGYTDGHAIAVPYMLGARPWWRAYCWSAFRNSTNMLNYRFAYTGEMPQPFKTGFWAYGRQWRIGYQLENGYYVPVLSI